MPFEHELKNAYIGLGCWWTPGSNTVAYYPLKSDVLDYSGHSADGSGNPNSFTDGVANYSGNSTTLPKAIINRSIYTVSVWANNTSNGSKFFIGQHTSSSYGFNIEYQKNTRVRFVTGPNSNTLNSAGYTDSNISGWKLLTAISDGTNTYLYINGELKATNTYGGTNNQTLYLGYDHGYGGGAWSGQLSELIFESVAWTAAQVLSYYNSTKANYGL